MYGILEGEPFQVFVRRETRGNNLVIRFECKEGMGILGIRKAGRTDPAPSAAYEEEAIEPSSLRAGRFVHVLGSGQRQSYALSRISGEIAERLPQDAWVELRPQTEYGFRYLIAPDESLTDGPTASATPAAAAAPQVSTPATGSRAPTEAVPARRAGRSGTPGQAAVSPPLAEAMLSRLPKEQAVEYLRAEMERVAMLQRQVEDLEDALNRSKGRERDLLEVLAKWQDSAG